MTNEWNEMKYLVNAIVVALIVLSVAILLNSIVNCIINRNQNKKISELENTIVVLEKVEK